MATKHKNYVPQVRKVKPSEAINNDIEREVSETPSYEQLNALLEIPTKAEDLDTWDSVSSYIYLRDAETLNVDVLDKSESTREMLNYLTIATAATLIEFDEVCRSLGYDVVKNPGVLRQLTQAQKIEFMSQVFNKADGVTNNTDDLSAFMVNTSFMTVATTYVSNERVAIDASYGLGDDKLLSRMDMTDEQIQAIKDYAMIYYVNLSQSPSRFRRNTSRMIDGLRDPELKAFIESEVDRFGELMNEPVEENQEAPHAYEGEIPAAGQEVDFTILPKGTDVREYTERLIAELSGSDRDSVDIKRVGVLESLREQFGYDRTYYVHGIPSEQSETGVRKDYIGLVIQSHDAAGKVISEDAIAVSPLEKRHAGYIFRQDVSSHSSWRETLSLPKVAARANGARPLKFTEVEGRDKYEAYVDKALELLTCPADKFSPNYELYFQKSSKEYILREKPVAKIGAKTLQAVAYP